MQPMGFQGWRESDEHRAWNYIRSETYENINILGDLMKELKRSVSMDEALMYLLKCRTDKPSEFAGSWKMDENEVEKIKSELKDIWKRWEL